MSTRCPSLELCRRCTQQFERHTDCGCCRGKRIHSPFDAQPLQHRARDERITLAARVHRESDYGFLTSSPASASEGWLASSEKGGPPFPGRMETLVGSLAKLMSRGPTTAQPRRCRDNLSANLRVQSTPFAKPEVSRQALFRRRSVVHVGKPHRDRECTGRPPSRGHSKEWRAKVFRKPSRLPAR